MFPLALLAIVPVFAHGCFSARVLPLFAVLCLLRITTDSLDLVRKTYKFVGFGKHTRDYAISPVSWAVHSFATFVDFWK